jgi:HAE1 family hydrophobic/amphiphilic exporter-1
MISDFFIARPVLANVLAIPMMVIGGVAVLTLPVAQYLGCGSADRRSPRTIPGQAPAPSSTPSR